MEAYFRDLLAAGFVLALFVFLKLIASKVRLEAPSKGHRAVWGAMENRGRIIE